MRWRETLEHRILWLASLGFLVGCTLLSWLITSAGSGAAFPRILRGGSGVGRQVLTGILAGAGTAGVVIPLVERLALLRPLRDFSREVLQGLRLGRGEVLLLASVAGWSEELLFRGAVQPLLGTVATSVLFVLAHGLFDLRPRGRAQFAGLVFLAGLGLGWLARGPGLLAAMVAHAVFDAISLLRLREESFRDAPGGRESSP